MDPLLIIDEIKKELEGIIKESNLKYVGKIDDALKLYSADICKILFDYYPSASIMMHKFYKSCAILINNKAYNGEGLVSIYDYHLATMEEVNYIKKSLPHMSSCIFDELNKRIFKDDKEIILKVKKR